MRHHVSQYFRQNLDKHKSYKNFLARFFLSSCLSLDDIFDRINQWFQVISLWDMGYRQGYDIGSFGYLGKQAGLLAETGCQG